MRIVLVYGMNNNIGGIESYLLNIYSHIQKQVKFVFLIEKLDSRSIFIHKTEIEKLGGEYIFIPEHHHLADYIRVFRNILREYKARTNIIYFNINYIAFDILPITLSFSERYHVITHSHNTMLEPINDIRYRFSAIIRTAYGMSKLKRLKVERLAITEQAGNYLYKGKPFKIVSPGVAVEKFSFHEEVREEMRQKLDLKDTIVLGFVGRIMSVKNPLFLLDILMEIRKSLTRVKLLVVGDGIMRDEMQKKVNDYGLSNDVVFTLAVKNVQDYFQAMDILLAPSFSEGLGLSIIEAQSIGLPCICAKGNIPNVVDVTGTVLFCELRLGSKGWADCIMDVLSKKYDRVEMHKKVETCQYNINNSIDKLLRVIGKV